LTDKLLLLHAAVTHQLVAAAMQQGVSLQHETRQMLFNRWVGLDGWGWVGVWRGERYGVIECGLGVGLQHETSWLLGWVVRQGGRGG
jgi:hypothetical protein